MRRPWLLLLMIVVDAAACGHGTSPHASCEWPQASSSPLPRDHRRSLRDDALAAEDLAIRYADSRNAPHSGHFQGFAAYEDTMRTCATVVYSAVARQHHVVIADVRRSLTQRPLLPDVLVLLPFVLLYVFVARRVITTVRASFTTDGERDAMAAGIAALVGASLLVSFLGVLVADWYSVSAEVLRVGNGHLSYRTERIPVIRHRVATFVAGVLLFWLIALVYRCTPASRSRRGPIGKGPFASW